MRPLAPAHSGKRTDTNRAYHLTRNARTMCFAAILLVTTVRGTEARAQHLAGRAIAVENMSVSNDGRNMVVDMDLRLDSLRMPSNRRLVFTPVIKNDDHKAVMPQIVLNGRRQDIVYKRRAYRDFAAGTTVAARQNGTRQTLHYNTVLPYEQY